MAVSVVGVAVPLLCSFILIAYLYALNNRLETPHPATKAYVRPDDEELLDSSRYDAIDELEGVPAASRQGYAIIGSDIVRLLLKRGESLVRIIDIASPPLDILPHVHFVKADVSDAEAVRSALSKPLEGTGEPPSVVHYTAAAIRYWERAPVTRPLSAAVNVTGVRNAIEALEELTGDDKIFIFTASVAISLPRPRFFPLLVPIVYGHPYRSEVRSDYDEVTPEKHWLGLSYDATKREGERIVLEANGKKGLRTASVRAGMGIIAPRGVFVASYLRTPINPSWGGAFAQTAVACVDVARAHLILEQGVRDRPDEAAGQAFLATGDGDAWRFRDVWRTVQLFAGRDLHFYEVPAVLMFLVGHVIEAITLGQYYACRALGVKATLSPSWLGMALMLQPGIFATATRDVVVDDSRFRKVLGYRHVYTTAQAIRHAVDSIMRERAEAATGPLATPGSR